MRPIGSCIPLVALLAGLASCTALLGDDFEIVGKNVGGGSAGNGDTTMSSSPVRVVW